MSARGHFCITDSANHISCLVRLGSVVYSSFINFRQGAAIQGDSHVWSRQTPQCQSSHQNTSRAIPGKGCLCEHLDTGVVVGVFPHTRRSTLSGSTSPAKDLDDERLSLDFNTTTWVTLNDLCSRFRTCCKRLSSLMLRMMSTQ